MNFLYAKLEDNVLVAVTGFLTPNEPCLEASGNVPVIFRFSVFPVSPLEINEITHASSSTIFPRTEPP